MRRCTKILKALFALVFAFVGVGVVSAEDYVDELNSKPYIAGQGVIYELNIGSYTQEGTFKAAQTKLSELKSLGVDIVWIMPIYPRDGELNSPYAATDFKAVNPSYGTIADLKDYVTAAHALGMQVWLDWVPNHTSTKNVWLTSHPEYYKKVNGQNVHPASNGNYYRDGETAPNGAIVYNDVYQLDYDNTDLRNAMNDCLKFWIDQTDIDGYRCDMVSSNGIPADYWSQAIPLIKKYKAGKTITFLGEGDFSNDGQARLRNVGFDYDYAWNFQETGLQNGFGARSYATPLITAVKNFVDASSNLGVGRLVYLTNHDQNWNGDKKTLTQKYGANKYLLTVLIHTLYGMPLIYNGEEAGGDQALNYFEDTKIDWSASDAKMYNTLRTLAAIKHSEAALRDGKTAADNGNVTFLSTDNDMYVLAYKRTSGNSEVVVLLNTSTAPQTVTVQGVDGTYSLWLNSETIGNGTSRKSFIYKSSATVQIPAKGYLVYVKGNFSDEDINDNTPVITDLTDNTPTSIFYESDVKDADVHAWFWNGSHGGEEYTANGGGWPGDALKQLGKTTDGKYIYKLTFNLKEGQDLPSNLIITENGDDDAHKTVNGATFVNHGYYTKGSNVVNMIVPTGINSIYSDKASAYRNTYYDLRGRSIGKPQFGIYIHNGKKYIAK